MRLFPQDNEVVLYESGFEDDLLGRDKLSKQLSELIEKIEDPLVLALDDKWGSGKSFFLKRWVAAHKNDNAGKATTVYFDAFENDYLSDPLVSIIAAVGERIPSNKADTVKKWKSTATKLVKPALRVGLSFATFGATKHFDEMGDVIADAVGSEGKAALDGLWEAEKERQDAILAFKSVLTELTESDGAPIVIVVDELDRCRPDYALSVLEVIKHFFSVPRVHFILGVNLISLENSVRARYGDAVDAEGYLRKFINVSFSLPKFLVTEGNVDVAISYATQMSSSMGLPEKISKRCIHLLKYIVQVNDVSLRDVGKILSKIALVPPEASEKKYYEGWIDVLCVLLVSSVVDPQFQSELISKSVSFERIMSFLGATNALISDKIEETYNENYDHDLTIWLVEIAYCCCPKDLKEAEYLPAWKDEIGQQFGNYMLPRKPNDMFAMIQKDWVDLFRL
ncbi:KAP family P-loop domain protein [Pseudovibrio sp. Ad13]|uniref:KAP family P-loop NTPase fold protein n=1 Tax=Pseudovibrio sp. Ad13 TaxID=989396 RepID=UPI0007AE82EC|nr:P-loop NTPase fold protein [Pseudovibrio sp. Ad13]KZK85838.1 KAP family P-loop domain protein [Pseudovibrio sp. Ad13]